MTVMTERPAPPARGPRPPAMVNVNTRMPIPLVVDIDKYAESVGKSRSEATRELIEAGLERAELRE